MTLVRRHRVLHRLASLFEAINAAEEGEMRECGEARRKKERQLARTRIRVGRGSRPLCGEKTANAALHFPSGDNGGEW